MDSLWSTLQDTNAELEVKKEYELEEIQIDTQYFDKIDMNAESETRKYSY